LAVAEACQHLRALGIADPLLEVDLARHGRQILARVGEYVFVPDSGQLALATASDYVSEFLEARRIKDQAIREAVRRERSALRRRTKLRLPVVGEARTALELRSGASETG
jgi:hypothetical protein